jgi:ribosome-binding factor A
MASLARSGKVVSQRQLRAGELVRQALAQVLAREEILDPDVEGKVISVTEVRLSPDLRSGVAFVMPLGGDDVEGKTVKGLNASAKWISGQIAKRVSFKYVPTLKFEIDESFDSASGIEQILRSDRVTQDLDEDDEDDEDLNDPED